MKSNIPEIGRVAFQSDMLRAHLYHFECNNFNIFHHTACANGKNSHNKRSFQYQKKTTLHFFFCLARASDVRVTENQHIKRRLE